MASEIEFEMNISTNAMDQAQRFAQETHATITTLPL